MPDRCLTPEGCLTPPESDTVATAAVQRGRYLGSSGAAIAGRRWRRGPGWTVPGGGAASLRGCGWARAAGIPPAPTDRWRPARATGWRPGVLRPRMPPAGCVAHAAESAVPRAARVRPPRGRVRTGWHGTAAPYRLRWWFLRETGPPRRLVRSGPAPTRPWHVRRGAGRVR